MLEATETGVAVLLSGWLGRRVPGDGASVRKHVVDVLAADVFIAATYTSTDCADGGGGCLLTRVRALRPFADVTLARMLGLDELRRLVRAWPRFAEVEAYYRSPRRLGVNWMGLNAFAPVLGNTHVSVLRQLHDYSRSYAQLQRYERRRHSPNGATAGTSAPPRRYAWLVHARWEAVWLAAHPPLALLDARLVWVPARSEMTTVAGAERERGFDPDGVSDRHAVVPRRHAAVYFGRWELLQDEALLETIPIEALTHDDPEHLLENVLIASGVPVGAFPMPSYIGCCDARTERCWNPACHAQLLSSAADCAAALGIGPGVGGALQHRRRQHNWSAALRPFAPSPFAPSTSPSPSPSSSDGESSSCLATGKSHYELVEAARNWRWLQCPGARLVAAVLTPRPFPPSVARGGAATAEWVRRYGRAKPRDHRGMVRGWRLWQGQVHLVVPLLHNHANANVNVQLQLQRNSSRHSSRGWWAKQRTNMLRVVDGGDDGAMTGGGNGDGEGGGEGAANAAAAPAAEPTACPLHPEHRVGWPGSQQYGPLLPAQHGGGAPSGAGRQYRQGTPRREGCAAGVCAVTHAGRAGDCDHQGPGYPAKGSFGTGGADLGLEIRSMADCALACWRYCAKCRYVSYSRASGDCSWFDGESCNLAKLSSKGGAAAFRSCRVAARAHNRSEEALR